MDTSLPPKKKPATHLSTLPPTTRQCYSMCMCVGGPVVCHVTSLRESRQSKRMGASSASLAASDVSDLTNSKRRRCERSGSGSGSLAKPSPLGSGDGASGDGAIIERTHEATFDENPTFEADPTFEEDLTGKDVSRNDRVDASHHNDVSHDVSHNVSHAEHRFQRWEWLPADLRVENEALKHAVVTLRREEETLRNQLQQARREAASQTQAKTLRDIATREKGAVGGVVLERTRESSMPAQNPWSIEVGKAYQEWASQERETDTHNVHEAVTSSKPPAPAQDPWSFEVGKAYQEQAEWASQLVWDTVS